jgi:hypothetical protein
VQMTVLPFVVVAAAAILWMRWSAARAEPSYAGE